MQFYEAKSFRIGTKEKGEKDMSVYPFRDKIGEYLLTRKGVISDVTWANQDRRLRRMDRELIALKEQGMISTMAPSKMTPEDVKTFILFRKAKKVGASDLSHDITLLEQFLTYSGNYAVQVCLQKNTGLKPKDNSHQRLDPLPMEIYRTILARSKEIDYGDFPTVRAYAMVLLYIGTGARNKEIRFCRRDELNDKSWLIHFTHVKGEDTYGRPRNVPIPEEIRPMMSEYLYHRDVWLAAHNKTSEMLFFQLGGECSTLSSNSIRKIKKKVEDQIGHKFELRDCRRAFGQTYKDRGLEMEKISRLMGHSSTRVTELYYCGVSENDAIDGARKLW